MTFHTGDDVVCWKPFTKHSLALFLCHTSPFEGVYVCPSVHAGFSNHDLLLIRATANHGLRSLHARRDTHNPGTEYSPVLPGNTKQIWCASIEGKKEELLVRLKP
jgi:hypothetical protein